MKKLDEMKVLHSAGKVIREKKKSIKVKAPVKEKNSSHNFMMIVGCIFYCLLR